jgi:AraC-like DNA-binding protein
MSYREHAPPADLAHVLTCTWRRVGRGEEVLVLPDGCVDVVVAGGRAHVAGPDLSPHPTVATAGKTIAGVRFRPGAAAAVLGVPAEELRDLRVPLEDLWGPAGREAAERAGDDPVALVAALARRLREAAPDPRVLAAARRLDRAPGTRVPALADALGLGERQLRRRFTEGVGYGPKTFARIARFRAAVALLRGGAAPAEAAYAAGYADQPHLTRELVALAGRTPASLADPVQAAGLTVPSSRIVQDGLCATSQAWPSGSRKMPEYPPQNVSAPGRPSVPPAASASASTASTSAGERAL